MTRNVSYIAFHSSQDFPAFSMFAHLILKNETLAVNYSRFVVVKSFPHYTWKKLPTKALIWDLKYGNLYNDKYVYFTIRKGAIPQIQS